MDNVEKTVDNIIEYCKKNNGCDNCVFNFQENLQENKNCGINYPATWKGINFDKKDFLMSINDLQKAQNEIDYYKEIYFGGNV